MKKILLILTSILSAVVIPLMITVSLLTFLFLNPDFHVSIIKNLKLVKTFIEAKNFQIESDIKREIEKTTGISAFKPEFDRLKKAYDEKTLSYNTLNKTEEYEKLDRQIDELDDLAWEKSPDTFKTKDEFNSFKKQKIKDLKSALNDIKKYRDENEDAIDKAEDEMDDAKDLLADAEDELQDKEKEALKIIEKNRGDFLNEMYHDVAKVEPVLTEKMNTLFIEKEVRSIISRYIDFFTSYNTQKESGNIYETRLDVDAGIIDNRKKINLPPFQMNLIVKEKVNGIDKNRNLLSEVFVETIRETPGLKSPWVMSKIFSMSDSWIVEKVANSFLEDAGFTYRGGVLKSGAIVISGRNAEITEKAMIAATAGRWLPYAAVPVTLVLLALVFIFSAEWKSGFRNAGYILKYPALIIIIGGIAVTLLSLVPGLLLPETVNDPVKYAFLDRAATTAAIHIFVPVSLLFFAISIAGGMLIRIGRR